MVMNDHIVFGDSKPERLIADYRRVFASAEGSLPPIIEKLPQGVGPLAQRLLEDIKAGKALVNARGADPAVLRESVPNVFRFDEYPGAAEYLAAATTSCASAI